ncbi:MULTISPECIES: ABC transporter ATP-binding protein [Pseudoalteromonas]|uniref:ATP-binding cassette domain-containing protein n=1 Tax=Pseudoalteromonas TaxID=53246 RepID=UPI000C7C10F4|nr:MULTISPECIES: ABC transporter ATP-binding protein [Pseudoalteromonas]AUJ70692.1 Lactococcin-G-processing and transport ATP-binding protein LagD [Pseudoalteromonas sp. NC201]MBR8845351.1 ABC transporter ATP-binding protein [Pseudoalteromonas sp. JC3]MCF2825421.1 ABC transporter ATP-binding protein/permease [Pseudoalteromonas sp. OF5H-5]MCF2923200.1 ABC transporter ATP-binding protein/permease [Pseudoalteromonas sp. DL2-H1]MCG7553994.1 ABC transporter ATP-binding protein/permease [Pseudoalter
MLFKRLKLSFSYSKHIRVLFVFALLISLIGSFTAFFTQYLIDSVIPSGDMRFLLIFLMFYACYETLNLTIGYLSRSYRVVLEKFLDYHHLDKYLVALLTAKIPELNSYKKGSLIQRIYDAQNIKKYYLTLQVDIAVSFLTIFVLSSIILYMSPLIGLVMAISLGLLVVIYLKAVPKTVEYETQRFQIKSDFLSVVDDIVDGRETIRANNYKSQVFKRCTARMEDFLNRERDVSFLQQKIQTSTSVVRTVSSIAIRAIVVISILSLNKFTLGEMLTLMAFSEISMKTTMQILMSFMQLKRTSITLKRYREFLDSVSINEKELNDKPVECQPIEQVSVCGLKVGVNGKAVCDVPDTTFKLNRIYKLVGANGAGKTTFCKSLVGLFDPIDGEFSFKIGERLVNSNRRINHCAAYFPHDILFTTTLWENITLGQAIEQETVVDLLKKIGLWSVIAALPEQLHTQISDRVNPFSEGQRQIILFLRVYLSNKPILVFDEVFRGLDKHTSKIVGELINQKTNCIILYVAHDFTIDSERSELLTLTKRLSDSKQTDKRKDVAYA